MATLSKNQPCSCGSGKKYKRCCENLRDRLFKPKPVTLKFDVDKYFRQYEFVGMLNWLQSLLCYPGNQKFVNRIEFLLAQLFRIPLNEFKGLAVDRDVIIELFAKTKEGYDQLFLPYEDFTEYDQRKLIPLFFQGNRYYFFYANLERPYESYIDLITRYCEPGFVRSNGFEKFERLLTASLTMQTGLLSEMIGLDLPVGVGVNDKESAGDADKTEEQLLDEILNREDAEVVVPEQTFVDMAAMYFGSMLPSVELCESYSVKPGFLARRSGQDVLNDGAALKNFTGKLFVETPQGIRWLAPQLHVKSFMDIGRFLTKEKNAQPQLQQQFKNGIIQQAHLAFTPYHDVVAFKSGDKQIKTDADHIIFHDRSKLVFFVAVEYTWTEDFSKALEAAFVKSDDLRKKILALREVTITTMADGTKTIDPLKIELLFFIVFDHVVFNYRAALSNKDINVHGIFSLSFTDMRAVFSELKKGSEVIKFVKEETRIRNESQVSPGEYIERLAFYLYNGNSFHRSAREHNGIFFAPHMWHDYIHDKLWRRQADETVYLEIHRKTKDFYNEVEKIEDNVFRLTDTAYTSGAFLVNIDDFFWWVSLPTHSQELEDEEFRVSYNLMGVLYKEHIGKHGAQFKELLPEAATVSGRCSLVLLPASRMNGQFEFLKNGYIADQSGIYFRSVRFPSTDELTTFLVYDSETLWPHFSKDDNSAERLCVELYIRHLLKLSGLSVAEATDKGMQLTDSMIPTGARRYAMSTVNTFNAKIAWYNQPLSPTESDFGPVSRFVSSYLIKNNIEPGEYSGEVAKGILERLYRVLLGEIEKRIASFDKNFLLFAYKQTELAEGVKQRERLMLTMKANAPLDYDLTEKYRKDDMEVTVLTISQRFLLHAGLKVCPAGNKTISGEDWTSMLALAKVAVETSYSYENILHGLRLETLVVSDDHVLTIEQNDRNFDAEAYQLKDASLAIRHYGNKGSATDDDENEEEVLAGSDEELKQSVLTKHLPLLNEAFEKEMGFNFNDLIFVLHALEAMPFDKGDFYPVVHVDKHELMASIIFMDQQPIESNRLSRILDFITMEEGCFSADNLLLQGQMLKYKERLLVSPIVKLKDETLVIGPQCAHNALMNWNNLGKGIFIFNLPENSAVLAVVRGIHKEADRKLEEYVFTLVKQFLPENQIAFRLDNFKRLSKSLPAKPPCGEIDLLCTNLSNKTVFVVEVKNVIKRPSNYHISNNIVQFFTSGSSYYNKLVRKKQYIEEKLTDVLGYFGITDTIGWHVKEVFVSNDLQFAAFYKSGTVDFILPHQLEEYILL